MEIYKDLTSSASQEFEKLLNSQLSKIQIEEGKIIEGKIVEVIEELEVIEWPTIKIIYLLKL